MMRKYEIIYIIDAEYTEEQIKALNDKFTSFVEANKGTVEGVEEWGKKKLAYPIAKKAEGYYVLLNAVAGTEFPALIERQFRITDGILKFLVISKED